ncbi:MAG: hypothetical protein DHS80DRAFT_33878 [Piptocephalis tieghemiana]|nr:MAG: hypothetical protein DHS80DRAFT_33878 [Piptocephalis tieghemiana]
MAVPSSSTCSTPTTPQPDSNPNTLPPGAIVTVRLRSIFPEDYQSTSSSYLPPAPSSYFQHSTPPSYLPAFSSSSYCPSPPPSSYLNPDSFSSPLPQEDTMYPKAFMSRPRHLPVAQAPRLRR